MTDREAFEHWVTDEGKYPDAAERAGDGYRLAFANNGWWIWQAAIRHERSECAKVCEAQWSGVPGSAERSIAGCAAAIRARGN